MPDKKEKRAKRQRGGKSTPCESCLYFDVLDESGVEGCTVDIDEDEAARERLSPHRECPYYRYYDEYKLVQKQN